MWVWVIGFVVIVGIIVAVTNRRGSTGAGRDYDLPGQRYNRQHDSGYGTFGGGGGFDGGEGF